MRKFISSTYFPLIFIPIAFIFTLIYSWATSPLFLGDCVDSSIFKTIGLGITQGKLPYVDLFDHKGGIFFMIESLGWFLECGRWGLFIIQVIFLSSTLFILFKTASLLLDKPKAFGATMCCLMLYIVFMESGNQCESYMIPFTALTLYLATKYFIKDNKEEHSLRYSLVYGVCFAIVFWIRPNDAVSQIGSVMAGIFLFLMYRKRYLNAILNAALFFVGCAIITLPLIGYFAYHGCTYELMEGTFLFNLKYVSDNGISGMLTTSVSLFIFLSIIWLSYKEHKRSLNFIFIPMLLLTLLLIGKRDYGHYLIIIVIPAIFLFTYLIKLGWYIILGLLLVGIATASIQQHKYVLKSIEEKSRLKNFYSQTERIINNVPENERDMIWNLNLLESSNDDEQNIFSILSTFINAGITPCNRIFVNLHLHAFPKEESVTANMPKWILADPTMPGYNRYSKFLEDNYIEIDATDGTCIGDVVLYKKQTECRL